MNSEQLSVKTGSRTHFLDITGQVAAVIGRSGVKSGLCCVYVPHTTAGVTINENADPDVTRDIDSILEKMVPWDDGYHHSEGNSAAHVKAGLMGFSVTVPFERGKMLLGTWQAIYFCDFDGPRNRKFLVKIIEG